MTVAHAAVELSMLQTPLRYAWDLQKYQFNKPGQAASPNDAWKLDKDKADIAIKSDFFWAYNFMLIVMCSVVLRVNYWMMGCTCHSADDYKEFVASNVEILSYQRFFRHLLGCVMCGHRAPEVVSGEHEELIESLWDSSLSFLTTD